MAAYKKTLGDGVAITFISAAAILDTIKFALFFLELIPGLGTAVDLMGSEAIAIIEIVFIFGGLGLFGAYSGKNFVGNILTAFGGSVVDLIPFIDHSPSTTISVLLIIRHSRSQDKKRHQEEVESQQAAQMRREQQQILIQRAQEAALRAQNT